MPVDRVRGELFNSPSPLAPGRQLGALVSGHPSGPLDVVRLTPLMELTWGRPEIVVALIDGPVAMSHSDLAGASIREIPGRQGGKCALPSSAACMLGTFVAGISALGGVPKPQLSVPAVRCWCALFLARQRQGTERCRAPPPDELAAAIIECVEADGHVMNVSAALAQPSSKSESAIEEALGYAARSGVTIAAAFSET